MRRMSTWATWSRLTVRRHEGRRGRPLDVLVEWEGEDSDGDLWEESWVSVTELTPDLRAEARQLESDLFGSRPGPTVSRRAERRAAAVPVKRPPAPQAEPSPPRPHSSQAKVSQLCQRNMHLALLPKCHLPETFPQMIPPGAMKNTFPTSATACLSNSGGG